MARPKGVRRYWDLEWLRREVRNRKIKVWRDAGWSLRDLAAGFGLHYTQIANIYYAQGGSR